MTQPALNDLTEMMKLAQRGLKKDMIQVAEQVPDGCFYLSLARALNLENPDQPPAPELPITSHMVNHPDGTCYVALFTRKEFAAKAQKDASWQTEEGTQEICVLPARNALYYAYKLISSDPKKVVGAFINPYNDEFSLQLNGNEVASLFEGVPIPLEAYAKQVPFGEDDALYVRPADLASVPDFVNAIKGFLAANPQITHYEVVALFDEQRDVEPYLGINFAVDVPENEYSDIAHRFIEAIKGTLPERLQVLFNEKLPSLL